MSFWTTLITFGFRCECPNSFPSDLGHFEGLAFFQYFAVLGLDPGGHDGGRRKSLNIFNILNINFSSRACPHQPLPQWLARPFFGS